MQHVNFNQMLPADLQLVLFAACRHGYVNQVSWLVEHVSHTTLSYAIIMASQYDQHPTTMLLMLCKAAIEGRVDFIRFLYGDYDDALRLEPPAWYVSEAHIAMPAASVATYMPIKLALAHKNDKVSRREG